MFLTWFLLCLKNVLAVPHCFIKIFYLHQSYGILYSPWCNNFYSTYHKLREGAQVVSIHLTMIILTMTLSKRKIYLKKNHAYLIHNHPHAYWRNNVSHIFWQGVDIYNVVKHLTSLFYKTTLVDSLWNITNLMTLL